MIRAMAICSGLAACFFVANGADLPPLPGPGISLPVDLDGDGRSTFADRYLFNHWLESGGSLTEALSDAKVESGTLNLAEFFDEVRRATAGAGGQAQLQGQQGPCVFPLTVLHFLRGDADNDGGININDGNFIFNYLFLNGPTPGCLDSANTNGDAQVDITDGTCVG